jgi:hypothetical protein
MEDFIKSQIGKMKGIKADGAYFERSFQTISATPQNSGLVGILNSKLSYSLASVAIVLVLVVLSFNPTSVSNTTETRPVASLSDGVLQTEVSGADFRIHVAEASYFNNSAAKVASALDEIVRE